MHTRHSIIQLGHCFWPYALLRVALVVLILAMTVPVQRAGAVHTLLDDCSHDSYHWYANAVSGTGDVAGTRVLTYTPTSWSVDHTYNQTWAEEAWLNNEYDLNKALRSDSTVGIFHTTAPGRTTWCLTTPSTTGIRDIGHTVTMRFLAIGPILMRTARARAVSRRVTGFRLTIRFRRQQTITRRARL